MKKTLIKSLLFFMIASFSMGCSDTSVDNGDSSSFENSCLDELSTEVSFNGTRMGVTNTIVDYSTPTIEDVYYYIRIDNRIPGCGSFNSALYFPQTSSGKSMFSSLNKGSLNTTKEGVIWKYFDSDNITSYLYDTTGKTTVVPLVDIPSIENILNANENTTYNTKDINTDTLHIIWYVTKFESNIWHVDGVLTGKSTTNTDSIPDMDTNKNDKMNNDAVIKNDTVGNIIVDIHQQEHKDWGEIKTSIHLRDSVNMNNITIIIPIDSSYIIEKDDFAVRQWKSYYTLKNENGEVIGDILDLIALSVDVRHTEAAIIYTIVCDPKYIKQFMSDESKDGVTIEIHTYTKIEGDNNKEVWEQLKNSTTKPNIGNGLQISSALYE